MIRRHRARRPLPRGNIGAAIGALVPIIAGGAALLRNPAGFAAPAPAAMAAPAPIAPTAIALPAPSPLAHAPPDRATPACLARFQIDLPRQRGDAAATRDTLLCRRGYVLSYDIDTRDPDWVMERLSPADLTGPAKRTDPFGHDPLLPAGIDASNADYASSGFDRGHQAPAGDAKFAQGVMDDSFFFSNMAPQIGIGFNRGAWKYLEETVRAWVMCGGHPDLYVITGPIYGARPGAMGADRVAVPSQYFKIVYDPNSGRAVGFVLPNRKIGATLPDLQAYVRPIAAIETETGLDFFRGMDRRRQTVLEASAGTAWAHGESCPSDTGS